MGRWPFEFCPTYDTSSDNKHPLKLTRANYSPSEMKEGRELRNERGYTDLVVPKSISKYVPKTFCNLTCQLVWAKQSIALLSRRE